MPRSSFQKLKIIYIMEYLLKNSDENHAVTTSQIIAYLKSHYITAERKTIYSDIEALRDFGLDIIQVSEGNNHGYYVASRDFELPELKLLVDSVQSSKFITHKKTLSLIKKIEKLASIHSAQLLNRQVFVKNRIGMFTGEEVKVHLRFENHLVGAVLDRLGRDVILVPDGEDHFTVWTDVIVSPQFFAWLCGFQTAAKVIGPDDVVKQMAEHVKSIAAQYE